MTPRGPLAPFSGGFEPPNAGHGEISVAIRRAERARLAFVTFAVTMRAAIDAPVLRRHVSDRYNFIQI